MGSAAYLLVIMALQINLPDPPGIPIRCRAHENIWVQAAKLKFFSDAVLHGVWMDSLVLGSDEKGNSRLIRQGAKFSESNLI